MDSGGDTAAPATLLSFQLGTGNPAKSGGTETDSTKSQEKLEASAPVKFNKVIWRSLMIPAASSSAYDLPLQMRYRCVFECRKQLIDQVGFLEGESAHSGFDQAREKATYLPLTLGVNSGSVNLPNVMVPTDVAIIIPNHIQGEFSGHGNEAILYHIMRQARVDTNRPLNLDLVIRAYVFNPFRWSVGYNRYYIIDEAISLTVVFRPLSFCNKERSVARYGPKQVTRRKLRSSLVICSEYRRQRPLSSSRLCLRPFYS